MIRVLFFIVFIALLVFGLGWVSDQPGELVLTFQDRRYETSPLVALGAVLALALVVMAVLWLFNLLLRAPRRIRARSRRRRRDKGIAALSRGLVAASAGDVRRARRATTDATRHLGGQPMTLLLEAQTALLADDREAAERVFTRLAENPETRVVGLRGLYMEARRRGDLEAAHAHAEAAHRIAPLPWAGEAVLEHHSANRDWTAALDAVEANLARKIIDKPTARRQRAVLQTAIAREIAESDPAEALRLANDAVALAPDLVPATAIAARLLVRRGDMRKASRLIERAWRIGPHPDLADVYLDVRAGDSNADRLRRARTLSRLAPRDPESQMTIARAAIAAREFSDAREAMETLISPTSDTRPTARMCRLMADLEEAEHGPSGVVREWLARAATAGRDKAWVADGVVSDEWAPVSPVTGKIDAWVWTTPPERLTTTWTPPEPEPARLPAAEIAAVEAPPVLEAPVAAAPPPPSPPVVEPAPAAAAAPPAPPPPLAPVAPPPEAPPSIEGAPPSSRMSAYLRGVPFDRAPPAPVTTTPSPAPEPEPPPPPVAEPEPPTRLASYFRRREQRKDVAPFASAPDDPGPPSRAA